MKTERATVRASETCGTDVQQEDVPEEQTETRYVDLEQGEANRVCREFGADPDPSASSRTLCSGQAEDSRDGGPQQESHSDSEEWEVDGVLLSRLPPEDESHYITTHEIQLSELSDHERDSEAGAGSSTSWDAEDASQVCSFVDYWFDGEGGNVRAHGTAAGEVSTLLESDPPASANFSTSNQLTSDVQHQQSSGDGGGQIHLSIRTTSRAINEPGSIQGQENILYHARRAGDVSSFVFRGVDGKVEKLHEKCFIAAPRRLHLGGKFSSREGGDFSSGTSSAVSELDDADKEVRSLTARAFRSLAGPYLDTISFSTSSGSSASEHAINRWSTFVDLKYGNMDQSVLSCQNSTASFEIAKNMDNRSYTGIALAGLKPPPSKIFSLNGNRRGASSSQKIQLMGQFGQGHGGVIRLTETLNFRCNVKSGVSGTERRSHSAAGSRSTDEVTSREQSGQLRGASKPTAMEDTHKKAVFASSLLKNVISKKMQFEQERRMERGEISEPPSHDGHRRGGGGELQSSKLSESGSDYALMCLEELGDVVESTSCDSQRLETNLTSVIEAGIETKKGALLRSQNSAFRCWKDEELRFQKDHKNHETPEGELPAAVEECGEEPLSAGGYTATKMSHLFVPTIQLLPGDGAVRQQVQTNLFSDSALQVKDSTKLRTSRSPEIKIKLRSCSDGHVVGASRLQAANSLIRAGDTKRLAPPLKGESSDKVPHFVVRDIRDNKGRLQTPIHQVRDVRKLVKSSYHFFSLDNHEQKSNSGSAEWQQTPKHGSKPVSPIVIKCQSVNTNTEKQLGALEEAKAESFTDKLSQEGASAVKPRDDSAGAKSEGKAEPKKQEPVSETEGSKGPHKAALEKLQAAVKTMEQLYVFEKNEWRRRSEPMSLTASEEQGGSQEARGPGVEKVVPTDSCPDSDCTALAKPPSTDSLLRRQDKTLLKALQTSFSREDRRDPQSLRTPAGTSAALQQNATTQTLPSLKHVLKSPKPLVGNRQTGPSRRDGERLEPQSCDGSFDNENYLTIPIKSNTTNHKQTSSGDNQSPGQFTIKPQGGAPPEAPRIHNDQPSHRTQRSSIVMETRAPEMPAVYQPLPLSQPQVYCFSPAVTPGPTLDPFQPTQRKMLLDPTTGNYYLVDTPAAPPTRRLFDPETGQYVDVPMPPLTPVPISPLALSPGAYGHTYMIYPGLMPAPSVIPARTLLHSQASVPSESTEKTSLQQAEAAYRGSPFYMATGKSPQSASGSHQQGAPNSQPLISITSQQGPRIIAPPSFDGTTMSFVVEHR